MKKAAALGAKLELCALGMLTGPEAPLEWMRHTARVAVADTAARIKAWAPSTSCSAPTSARPAIPRRPTASRCSWPGSEAEGITREQIETMGREMPGALLMG